MGGKEANLLHCSYRQSTKTCTLSTSYEVTGADLRFHLTKTDVNHFLKVKGISDSIRADCSSIHSDISSQLPPAKEDCIEQAQYDEILEKNSEKWLSEFVRRFHQ